VTPVVLYTISGNIVDGGAQPLEDVVVTMTGDSSHVTATDASGDYSIAGLPNGDYTITPTKATYVLDPLSDDVTISGGNQTSDFTSGVPESLPAFIGFEADTPVASPSLWSIGTGTVATMNIQADSTSFTPSSFTKAARANISSTPWIMSYNLGLLPTSGKLRIAALARTATGVQEQPRWGLGDDGTNPIGGLMGYVDTEISSDRLRVNGYNGSSETIGVTGDANVNMTRTWWKWLRLEIDIDAATGKTHEYHHDTPGPTTSSTVTATFADCGNWTYASVGMKLIWAYFDLSGVTDAQLAGFWIGTGDDAWPTV
jgi:hypothetical protein